MKKLLTLLTTFCLTSSAFAMNWQMVGARSMGMGGTGVATAQGTYAQYYNPALLAVHQEGQHDKQLSFGLGAQGETTSGVYDMAKKLMDMSDRYKALVANMTPGTNLANTEDLQTIFEGISNINDLLKNNTGVLFAADLGAGFKSGNFGVSIRSLGSMAAAPVIDRNNILVYNTGISGLNFSTTTTLNNPSLSSLRDMLSTSIQNANIADDLQVVIGASVNDPEKLANILINTIDGASVSDIKKTVDSMINNMSNVAEFINGVSATSGLYSDNKTRVMAEMAAFSEASLGYGLNIIPGISLGASVKVIEGTTAQTGIFILQDDMGLGGIIKDAWSNKKFSTNWGLDLGALVNFSDLFQGQVLFNPQIGITAKNINSPAFKRPEAPSDWTLPWNSDDYKLKPQIRAGASINPVKRITVAVDVDLNKNETTLKDYKSQQLAAGVEILAMDDIMFKLPIRLGINKNLAESSAPMYFTAGFATMGHNVGFEMAAAIGDGLEKVDGNNAPNALGLSMNFTVAF